MTGGGDTQLDVAGGVREQADDGIERSLVGHADGEHARHTQDNAEGAQQEFSQRARIERRVR
ncbi:MAG: hypothetical protein MZV63_07030 [Marinilabiliales bacterium]|nr:hypothetical protein [Marinilabiliales bacterium]